MRTERCAQTPLRHLSISRPYPIFFALAASNIHPKISLIPLLGITISLHNLITEYPESVKRPFVDRRRCRPG